MKLKNITVSLLCASLLLTMGQASEDTDIENTRSIKNLAETRVDEIKKVENVKYKINTNLSEERPSLPIYKVNMVDVKNNNKIEKIEAIFDFTAQKSKIYTSRNNSLSKMITDNKGRSIEYFDSGAIFFNKDSINPKKSKDILQANGLTKKTAKDFYSKKAEIFLSKNNLLQENMFVKRVTFETFQKISLKEVENFKKGINPITKNAKIIGAAVHFGYKIGNIPTWGAGSETTVYFDQDGISGYFNQIRDFSENKNGKEYNLISEKEAVKNYTSNKQAKNLLRATPMITKKVIIDNVQLVYHLKAVNKIQNKIEPKYLITGTLMGINLKGKEVKSEFKWLEDAIQ